MELTDGPKRSSVPTHRITNVFTQKPATIGFTVTRVASA